MAGVTLGINLTGVLSQRNYFTLQHPRFSDTQICTKSLPIFSFKFFVRTFSYDNCSRMTVFEFLNGIIQLHFHGFNPISPENWQLPILSSCYFTITTKLFRQTRDVLRAFYSCFAEILTAIFLVYIFCVFVIENQIPSLDCFLFVSSSVICDEFLLF